MKIHRGTVRRVHPLSPHMVRVTLGGDGIADFVSTGVGDEYVRLFFPHGEDPTDVSLPVVDGDGWSTPEGEPEAPMRTYTIRAVRPDEAEVDIDFVVHRDGVAGPWAARARPGHVLGLNSPTGLYAPPDDTSWQLLAGDLTGLPAVARLIPGIPAHVRTRVVIEVPDDADRIEMDAADHVEITWIVGGNGRGPSRLGAIVRSIIGSGRSLEDGYIWVAGETVALRDVRKFLRRELGLPATRFKVVGYWTPIADWEAKYAALPEGVQRELEAIWDEVSDVEDAQVSVEARLDALGL
ncbi:MULTISPECIES: siderophore-interacting protein [Microbacterium]|uniref:NADPH-dependent ferric siderophore reductase n=1 Tax=Microbacterium hominis TaxID=162426 RepID=A0A2K9DI27_9MICO|nr:MULTISPECIES: siderophore-interacting protein [Microbacterium]AUG29137.1 NADPH-dependent ferric siderophore reductase [Microbacterium hominis]QOC24998.1 siderophore-interacting protein [Microbacterium hominis]QOC29046.1 siderophore-interacting protein [Microbacterium hominis]QYF98741.1 siderophore-interacting protein [Microbacterium sp. PAMC21962]